MQFARQPACSVISLFNYIPLAERGQIHASKSHCTPIAFRRLSSRPARFSGGVSTRDLGNHLNQTTQTGHSERSGAVFSSSFAPANEPRNAAERLSTLSSVLPDQPGTEYRARFTPSRIQSHQQLVRQGHPSHSLRFPFGRHPFRKRCKVRIVSAHHSGHHIQNRSHIAATSTHRSFSFALPAVLRQRCHSR